ncbi:hypothetical protein GCM10027605_09030 [Micromonospora zhanjiangensis]
MKVSNSQKPRVSTRDWAPVTRGEAYDSTRPATTTASTPLACTTSASRNAENGVRKLSTPSRSGSSRRRRISTTTPATTRPAATPPRNEPANRPRYPSGPGLAPPAIRPTDTANRVNAVPSLIKLSARRTVRNRRGSRFARPATAAASVGASTAPSTCAAAGGTPKAWAVSATVIIVRITRATANPPMMGRLARTSRRLTYSASR